MMRIALCIVALGLITLGLWLIASSFTVDAPASAPAAPAQVISSPPQNASPVVLGSALLAGGVVFLVLIFRRR